MKLFQVINFNTNFMQIHP